MGNDVVFVGLLKWRTVSGVLVEERGRRWVMNERNGRPDWKISAWRETGGFHGWLWIRDLTPVDG